MTQPATATQTPADCVLAAVRADPAPAAAALRITTQQVLNLAQLAAHLRASYPASGARRHRSFTMSHWHFNPLHPYSGKPSASMLHQLPAECGTVACAAGHGPAAGIPPVGDASWASYAMRAFSGGNIDLYESCFGGAWSQFDDTPRGAAARICYLLQHGGNLDRRSASLELYQQYVE